MFRLSNTTMAYDWGSTTEIPRLLGTEPTGGPQAELWIGAHPLAPSRITGDARGRTLADLVAEDPVHHLGAAAAQLHGGRLPFLLKLLAAERPLSIQVHPDRPRALAGFAREDALGIPRTAPQRTYRDPNHKPEVICALTRFEALSGWRDPARTAQLLTALQIPALLPWAAQLTRDPGPDGLRTVLAEILRPHCDQAAEAAGDLTRLLPERAEVAGPHRELLTALAPAAAAHPDDVGLVVALLLNHVTLAPGQALYLGAGRPHAYLHGTGVELMADSDNVLRCGLTSKHVDADELMAVVDFTPGGADPLTPRRGTGPSADHRTEAFPVPTSDFLLLRHRPTGHGEVLEGAAPRILLALGGEAQLADAGGNEVALGPGAAAYLPAGAGPVHLSGADGTTVFQATLPRTAPPRADRTPHRGGRPADGEPQW